jgi:D-alanine-D-alanine ligase
MRIAVLMGGVSSERDVSLASGIRVVNALRSCGHVVRAVDPAIGEILAGGETNLLDRGVKTAPPSLAELTAMAAMAPSLVTLDAVRAAEVVFIALHGGQGEDGTIQAVLDLIGARYTGSGHLASALAMDKDLSKHLFRAAKVPTADWIMWSPPAPMPMASRVVSALGLPVVVKPSKQGSTVGLTIVKSEDQLHGAIAEAARYDDEVMLESFIQGREFTVGMLGGEALPVGEIIPKHEIYDYECKYTPGMAREEFPARLTERETRTVQQLSQLAFDALKLRGYARIDFRLGGDGVFYCLEANTLPGLTELSLIPQAAAANGMTFPALCERIVNLAVEGHGRP